MEILGYSAAILIGVSLGLIGGGGSILTVPVLVYLFGIPAATATGYSLFVVGATALVGAVGYMRQGFVNFRIAILFGFPATLSVLLTRTVLVPAIPAIVLSVNGLELTKNKALLLVFAALMLYVSSTMIRSKPSAPQTHRDCPSEMQKSSLQLALMGFGVGWITGLVGVGGGFLYIPALVLFAGQTMKQAIGTSLFIIAMTSLFGFLGCMPPRHSSDWTQLSVFAVIAIGGILLGIQLSKHIPCEKLRPAFGYFVLVMGVFIVGRELLG